MCSWPARSSVNWETAEGGDIWVEFSWLKPAQLDRPPQAAIWISLKLVPAFAYRCITLACQSDKDDPEFAGGCIPDPRGAVGGGGGQQRAVG